MFRIQSLYLLLTSAMNFSILVTIIYYDFQGDFFDLYVVISSISSNLLLCLIFLHKKKNLQLIILKLLSLIYFFCALCCVFIFDDIEHYLFGLIGFSCLFNLLAIKNIRKDIELLNSVNRLR